jgi:hypothetical protein
MAQRHEATNLAPVTESTRLTCAQLAAELNRLERRLKTVSDLKIQELLRKNIKTINRQIIAQGCGPINSKLIGKVFLETDFGGSTGPFDQDISLDLAFTRSIGSVDLAPFNLTFSWGTAKSSGGVGTFDPSLGIIKIPLLVILDTNGQELRLNLTMSTEKGDAHGPFTPQGVRLGADSTVVLAGATFDMIYFITINVYILIEGVIAPHP